VTRHADVEYGLRNAFPIGRGNEGVELGLILVDECPDGRTKNVAEGAGVAGTITPSSGHLKSARDVCVFDVPIRTFVWRTVVRQSISRALA